MKLTLYTQKDLVDEIHKLGGELKQISYIKNFLKETKPEKWIRRYLFLTRLQIINKIKLHYLFKIKSKRVDF